MSDTDTHLVPRGWRYAGARSGIRSAGDDTALLVSDRPAAGAARVTVNRVRAACVQRAERLLPADGLRGVVVVSGNANALTGAAGVAADEALARGLADALGVEAGAVLTATTGIIGRLLPADLVTAGLPDAVAALAPAPTTAAGAILTTDTHAKTASAQLEVGGVTVTVHGMAKGAGMIHPKMATMLAFVTTDAALTPAAADALLGPAVDASFNRISVDGAQSSNDMVLLLANGAAGGPRLDALAPELGPLAAAVQDVLKDLARQIAADGEGATTLFTVEVRGAASAEEADVAAREVTRSSLVKAAVFGGDPNWGRVMVAAGQALAEVGSRSDPDRWRLALQGVEVYARGEAIPFDAAALSAALGEAAEVIVELDLGDGAHGATAWGCDLTYDYVRINAEYHT